MMPLLGFEMIYCDEIIFLIFHARNRKKLRGKHSCISNFHANERRLRGPAGLGVEPPEPVIVI